MQGGDGGNTLQPCILMNITQFIHQRALCSFLDRVNKLTSGSEQSQADRNQQLVTKKQVYFYLLILVSKYMTFIILREVCFVWLKEKEISASIRFLNHIKYWHSVLKILYCSGYKWLYRIKKIKIKFLKEFPQKPHHSRKSICTTAASTTISITATVSKTTKLSKTTIDIKASFPKTIIIISPQILKPLVAEISPVYKTYFRSSWATYSVYFKAVSKDSNVLSPFSRLRKVMYE